MSTNITYNPDDKIARVKTLGFTSMTATERKYEPQTQNTFSFQFLFDPGQVTYIANVANRSNNSQFGSENFDASYQTGLNQLNTALNVSLQNINAPTKSIAAIVIDFFNSRINFAGKPTYGTSNITLNNFIGIKSRNILAAWSDIALNPRNLAGGWARSLPDTELNASGLIGRNDLNDAQLDRLFSLIGYKVDGILLECARDGTIVNQWDYIGMWISQFTPGSYNTSGSQSSSQVNATLTVDMIQMSDTNYRDSKLTYGTITNN